MFFLFDGAKILFIFDLIIINACYNAHKIKRNEKKPSFPTI